MSTDLVTLLADLKENETLDLVRKKLNDGEDPFEILDDTRRAMEIIGMRFEAQTYFIPDLIYSGDILKTISEMIKPHLIGEQKKESLGRVLIGTVAGDIHDIGKDIVSFLLEVNGFEVEDIGVDAPPAKFVDAIQSFKPQIVGMSCLLTTSFDAMKATVEAIEHAGLRQEVKIMIGGGVVSESLIPYVGADGYEKYASGAVSLSKKWLGTA